MKRTWKKNELKTWFDTKTQDVLTKTEQEEIMFRLLEHHGISRLDWAVAQEINVDDGIWENYVADLQKQKPIQYILGYEYFAAEKFTVNEHVLIPRPETEELVSWIEEDNSSHQNLTVLEIGTGSGCIAISLSKKLKNSRLIATDVSTGALAVAKDNAVALEANVEFIEDDILNTKLSGQDYDIIVSNPPYIPLEDAAGIGARVLNHEPSLALFTEEKKPLQFYEAIILFALEYLNPNGSLYFEMHEDYAQEVLDIAKSKNLQALIRKDIYGKQRMIHIKKDEQ